MSARRIEKEKEIILEKVFNNHPLGNDVIYPQEPVKDISITTSTYTFILPKNMRYNLKKTCIYMNVIYNSTPNRYIKIPQNGCSLINSVFLKTVSGVELCSVNNLAYYSKMAGIHNLDFTERGKNDSFIGKSARPAITTYQTAAAGNLVGEPNPNVDYDPVEATTDYDLAANITVAQYAVESLNTPANHQYKYNANYNTNILIRLGDLLPDSIFNLDHIFNLSEDLQLTFILNAGSDVYTFVNLYNILAGGNYYVNLNEFSLSYFSQKQKYDEDILPPKIDEIVRIPYLIQRKTIFAGVSSIARPLQQSSEFRFKKGSRNERILKIYTALFDPNNAISLYNSSNYFEGKYSSLRVTMNSKEIWYLICEHNHDYSLAFDSVNKNSTSDLSFYRSIGSLYFALDEEFTQHNDYKFLKDLSGIEYPPTKEIFLNFDWSTKGRNYINFIFVVVTREFIIKDGYIKILEN